MQFTKEQLKEIEKSGKLNVDDFPIDLSDSSISMKLFNNLPSHLQGMAISFGFNDTVFRDDLFEYLCKVLLNQTTEEYYQSELAKQYFENDITIEINFSKLEKGRI